jgi:ribose transport system permease protein
MEARTVVRHVAHRLPLYVFLVAILVLGAFIPNLLSGRNIINVLVQASSLGVMAIGMSVVLIGGGIDISIPATMALGGILGAHFMRMGGNPWIGALIMVLTGLVIGCVNGYIISYLRLVPFVLTLATMYIITGLNVLLTREESIAITDMGYIDAILGRVGGLVPVPVLIFAVVAVVAQLAMKKSIFGSWLYGLGSSEQVSSYMGVPTQKMKFAMYAISGTLAGIAAVIISARLISSSASMGELSVVLNIIASAVVGGVSIYGGTGSPLGAVVGAIIISLITNIMNLAGVSYFVSLVIKGGIIIFVVGFDTIRRRRLAPS